MKKLNLLINFIKNTLVLKPKIGVTGLNPHCESILKVNEDKKINLPCIKSKKKKLTFKVHIQLIQFFSKKIEKI